VNDWGRRTFGQPCRECGFDWDTSQSGAGALVAGTPAVMADLLAGTDGAQRHGELAWSAAAYVAHVADNLRIWAERLAGLAAGDRGPVAPYDQDQLAAARHYQEISGAGALWSLDRAVADWLSAVAQADAAGITLVHPHRGQNTVLDVVRTNAHDAVHHCADVGRIMGGR
jgi:uncharacterized damage-inducible protein DinB